MFDPLRAGAVFPTWLAWSPRRRGLTQNLAPRRPQPFAIALSRSCAMAATRRSDELKPVIWFKWSIDHNKTSPGGGPGLAIHEGL